jgi:hypothetical protein
VLESNLEIKELLLEKEQDQHLINLLKKHCFEQSKEITKLKHKLENLQESYERLLLNSPNHNTNRKPTIIETAILARSRSESLYVRPPN